VRKVELVGIPDGVNLPAMHHPKTRAEITLKPAGSSAVEFNRQPALAIEVIKESRANALEVVQQVEVVMNRLQPQIRSAQLHLATSQAGFIKEATHATLDALWLAIGLSILVIWPFLRNWRATIISALAIPTSLLGTFVVLAFFGLNLDTITLLALALVIGIIVDDAIVDVENISRHLDEGIPPKQAAIEATNEIGLTVTAATLAIVAVFLPVALMQGSLGQFFRPFGITVAAAVLISLLVARTLSPLLASKWLRTQPQQPHLFLHRYQLLLQWALRRRWWVISFAFGTLALGLTLIPMVPKGFIPQLDRGDFLVSYSTPLPTSRASLGALIFGTQSLDELNPIHRTTRVGKQLADKVRQSDQVASVLTMVGNQGRPNAGTLYVTLKPNRSVTTAAAEDQIRQLLPKLADVKVTVTDIPFVSTATRAPLELAFTGDQPQLLQQTAEKVRSQLSKLQYFQDFDVSGTALTDGKVTVLEQLNHKPVVYLRAQLAAKTNLGDATSQAISIANQLKPSGVKLDVGGDSGQMLTVLTGFASTLTLSVLCVFGVLALLFRSWTDPLIIVFALPLAVIGSVLAVLLTGTEFGVISVIGIVFLFGLINKNAILLVDYANQLRQAGHNRTEALLQAGPVRLRPILMTTMAMILGMLPIACGWGAGAELRAPMAIAIIGGLFTSTLLSLIVVPVLYTFVDDWRQSMKSRQLKSRPLGLSNSSKK
jgi:multidrug efflux pump subunit AcrB